MMQRPSRQTSPVRKLTRTNLSKSSFHGQLNQRLVKQQRSKSSTAIFGLNLQNQRSYPYGRNPVKKNPLNYATANRYHAQRGINNARGILPSESSTDGRKSWLLHNWLQRSNVSLPDSVDTGIGSMFQRKAASQAIYEEIGNLARRNDDPKIEREGRQREPRKSSNQRNDPMATAMNIRTSQSPTKSVPKSLNDAYQPKINNYDSRFKHHVSRDIRPARPYPYVIEKEHRLTSEDKDQGCSPAFNSFSFRNVSLKRNKKGKFGFNVSSFKYIDNMYLPQIDAILPGSSAQINGIAEGDFIHLINRVSVEGIGLQRFLDIIIFTGQTVNLQFLHPNGKETITSFHYEPQNNADLDRRERNLKSYPNNEGRQQNFNNFRPLTYTYKKEDIRTTRPNFDFEGQRLNRQTATRNILTDRNYRGDNIENVISFDDEQTSFEINDPVNNQFYRPYRETDDDETRENRFRNREYNSFTEPRNSKNIYPAINNNTDNIKRNSRYSQLNEELNRRRNISRERKNLKENREEKSEAPLHSNTGPAKEKLPQGKLAKCTSVIDIGSVQDILLVKTSKKKIAPNSKVNRNPVEDWSVVDVIKWFKSIGQFNLSDIAETNDLDGPRLLDLDRNKMMDIGITDIYQRWKIEKEIEKLKKTVIALDEGDESNDGVIQSVSQNQQCQTITHI